MASEKSILHVDLTRPLTPLRVDVFEAELTRFGLLSKYPKLLDYLRYGFPIGENMPLIESTVVCPNYFDPDKDKTILEIILKDFAEDLKLGRLIGPLNRLATRQFLEGHFRTSPIRTMPKKNNREKFRVIRDLSAPFKDSPAVNDLIEEDLPTRAINFEKFAPVVARAPAGTQAAQIDIRSAYRNIPTRLDHLPFLTVSLRNPDTHEDEIYIDRVHPFGLKSAGGNLGMAVDASLDILDKKFSVDYIAKWVDDIVPLRYPTDSKGPPFSYAVNLQQITTTLEGLGWPLAEEKTVDFTTKITYLGFDWDLEAKTVALPESKREEFLDRLREWIESANEDGVSLEETHIIMGTLAHAANSIHPVGKSFLRELNQFLHPVDPVDPYKLRKPPPEVFSDMEQWRAILSVENAFLSLHVWDLLDPDIWVDASGDWGIALVVAGRWRAWRWLPGWKEDSREIGWAECIALEMAVRHIAGMGVMQKVVKIHSDNQGTIGQFRKGRGKNKPTNSCIRRATAVMMENGFEVDLEWVPSEENLADGPSRGVGLEPSLRLEKTFKIPVELWEFLEEV